jgi:glycosyltransferase involved in cell wall biosynthesis
VSEDPIPNNANEGDPGAGSPDPLVTVVIPTRDRWQMLSRTLRTVLTQDVALEVVIVDDASVDETPLRLAEVRDPRVRTIRHDRSEGVARSRNDAIAEARAPWVAFLDDDDLWAPHKLRLQLEAVKAANAGWCWSASLAVDAELRPLYVTPSASPDDLERRLLRNNWVSGPSGVMARTDLLRAVGGFDPALSAPADWDLWIRLAARAPGASVDEVLWAYVEHGANMLGGADGADVARPEFDLMVAKHGAAAERHGFRFGTTWWMRWVASRHRFAGRRFRAAATYLQAAISDRSPGDLLRAIGSLGGEGVWQRVRARVIGPPHAPPWLTEFASQSSVTEPADDTAA